MTAIADLDCAALTAAYRRGELSPVEVARDCLARIEGHTDLNAFMPIRPEQVVEAAAASQMRWRKGEPLGLADGVPATVKDNIWLKGYPVRRGSRISSDTPVKADSPAVARLREAGAVILGKTCMPEHGWIGACHSPLTGITRNPWSADHTPGGSTGGGAVAALLGLGLMHLGTDGAGSLRIPASFTGVFGMKPSFGRVPVYPAPLLTVLSHQGPITRTVADAAAMLSVIAQGDEHDMTASNVRAQDFTEGLEGGVKDLRVALSMRLGHVDRLDPDIERAVGEVARALEAQGAIVEEADPPLDRSLDYIRAMWWPVAAAIVDAVPAERRAEMDKGFLKIARRGLGFGIADYLAAYTARSELHNAMLGFHRRYDLLLTPTMPVTALRAGMEMPEEGAAEGIWGDDWLNWSPYTYPFNLTQQPAASVPCGLSRHGLPMGAQLVGRLGADALVLRAARAVERALPMPSLKR
jgi:aspartyl-tRNA(Asn)/glutamyl-tRNA(Gln) amidotransferase subunit A